MPARQAQSQVDPRISHLHTFFADVRLGIPNFDLIEVRALAFHDLLASSSYGSSNLSHVTKGHNHDTSAILSLKMIAEVIHTCFVLIIFLAS